MILILFFSDKKKILSAVKERFDLISDIPNQSHPIYLSISLDVCKPSSKDKYETNL